MADPAALPDIAHAIQLAVAPVFLLSGIAGLLGVMTNRLSRIIDRARHFEQRWDDLGAAERRAAGVELGTLERRRRLASLAINACTFAALMICLVVAVLFVEELLDLRLKGAAGVVFIVAMGALIVGLASFLREVTIATHTVRLLVPPPGEPGA